MSSEMGSTGRTPLINLGMMMQYFKGVSSIANLEVRSNKHSKLATFLG